MPSMVIFMSKKIMPSFASAGAMRIKTASGPASMVTVSPSAPLIIICSTSPHFNMLPTLVPKESMPADMAEIASSSISPGNLLAIIKPSLETIALALISLRLSSSVNNSPNFFALSEIEHRLP